MASWLAALLTAVVACALALCAFPLAVVGALVAALRRRSPLRWLRAAVVASTVFALGLVAARASLSRGRSIPHLAVMDLAALSIHRDETPRRSPDPRYRLLAGDLHCHAFPWDPRSHASRDLDETIRLARRERIDFIAINPHLWAGHLAVPAWRRHYRAVFRELGETLAARSDATLTLLPGVEYTDDFGGHAGLAFGDVDQALDLVDHGGTPSDFFRMYVLTGGLVTIHHPFLSRVRSRIPQPPDISWRPFTAPSATVDPVIPTLMRLATQVEAYNLGVSELRDRFALDDREHSLQRVFTEVERAAAQHRRFTVTGGTDSHSGYLRASMFVLAERNDPASIREAMRAGRTCVRAAAACSLTASRDGVRYEPVGAAFDGVGAVFLRADGDAIEVIRDGAVVARPARGTVVRVAVEPRCTVLRARVAGGWSGAVYANCALR